MALVAAKCTQCGANLEVDDGQAAAICPVCQTPFITEKAITNHNTTNITNIDHLHADVVQINDKDSIESRNRAGETFIKLHEYQKAEDVFESLANECPYDYRGWWGLIRAETQDFSDFDSSYLNKRTLSRIKNLYNKVDAVIEDKDRPLLGNKVEEYCEKVQKIFNKIVDDTNQKIQQTTLEYNNTVSSLNYEINTLQNKIAALTNEFNISINAKSSGKSIVIIISIIVGILLVVLWFSLGAVGAIPAALTCWAIYSLAKWLIEKVESSDEEKKKLYKKTYNENVQNIKPKIENIEFQRMSVREKYESILEDLRAELKRVGGLK